MRTFVAMCMLSQLWGCPLEVIVIDPSSNYSQNLRSLWWVMSQIACGTHGLWRTWLVAHTACGAHGLWRTWLVAHMACGALARFPIFCGDRTSARRCADSSHLHLIDLIIWVSNKYANFCCHSQATQATRLPFVLMLSSNDAESLRSLWEGCQRYSKKHDVGGWIYDFLAVG